jgi:hypothetical protein
VYWSETGGDRSLLSLDSEARQAQLFLRFLLLEAGKARLSFYFRVSEAVKTRLHFYFLVLEAVNSGLFFLSLIPGAIEARRLFSSKLSPVPELILFLFSRIPGAFKSSLFLHSLFQDTVTTRFVFSLLVSGVVILESYSVASKVVEFRLHLVDTSPLVLIDI